MYNKAGKYIKILITGNRLPNTIPCSKEINTMSDPEKFRRN